jgi:phosphonate transport system substrate-binding protein
MRGALSLVLLVGLAGCGQARIEDPKTLRFSAIPDQPPAQVLQQHKALVDRICVAIKKSCQWIPVDSYEALVERIGRNEIDVAYFGAATFAQASHRYQAVPLAMRDIDFRFTSVIVVRKASKAFDLDALKQTRFRFGNRSSTSAHFMLRQRLQDENIVPERYFSQVSFSSNHDETLRAVASGEADAGGINASVFYRRVADRDPSATALRAVWQTPPFTDYVWAARRQISAGLRQALVDAFLDLEFGSRVDGPALEAEDAAGYVPAFPSDFEEMTRVLRSQGAL